MTATPYASGRSCAGCTMCCRLLYVGAFDKPVGQDCIHSDPSKGCSIHARRPQECRKFDCAYVLDASLADEWAPKRCGLIVSADAASIIIYSDTRIPSAWRREPYFTTIRQWGAQTPDTHRKVLVFEGDHATAMLPSGEKALGAVPRGYSYLLIKTREGVYDVIAVAPDDPRAG